MKVEFLYDNDRIFGSGPMLVTTGYELKKLKDSNAERESFKHALDIFYSRYGISDYVAQWRKIITWIENDKDVFTFTFEQDRVLPTRWPVVYITKNNKPVKISEMIDDQFLIKQKEGQKPYFGK